MAPVILTPGLAVTNAAKAFLGPKVEGGKLETRGTDFTITASNTRFEIVNDGWKELSGKTVLARGPASPRNLAALRSALQALSRATPR